jgi:16S rRNA (guanine966-N2)-methyltransferase
MTKNTAPPREVRIIGGQWKRTKLAVLDKPGLRPTPDRVRETLFNWLGHDLTGWKCLDVFAGTGALGLEAASRGADEVTLVEQDPQLIDKLRSTVVKLQAHGVRVQRANGISVLSAAPPATFDLVFLDPPFEDKLWDKAISLAARAVKPEGFVYLEAPVEWSTDQLQPSGLGLFRYMRAGAVHAHLLQRTA